MECSRYFSSQLYIEDALRVVFVGESLPKHDKPVHFRDKLLFEILSGSPLRNLFLNLRGSLLGRTQHQLMLEHLPSFINYARGRILGGKGIDQANIYKYELRYLFHA